MLREVGPMFALAVLVSCGGAQRSDESSPGDTPPQQQSEEQAEPDEPLCGWREGESTPCTTDADCTADSACVEGLGNFIVPQRDDGVESMPPYDRETVRYCQPRACPEQESPSPPAVPEEDPAPEPEPDQ